MSGRPEETLSAAQAGRRPASRQVIAVASGKGGVGKSTVAVNLAVALAQAGARVGLLDADLYGPSIPVMLGLRDGRLRAGPDERIQPEEVHGLKVVSAGFMVPESDALIWRGAIVHKLIHDLVYDVDWDDREYLVVDLPPGTGDVPLSLHDAIAVSGVVLVTTPQQVALADVQRAYAMCVELALPVIGLVENMSFLACPHCHGHVELFPPDGGRELSAQLGVPLLARIPFDPQAAHCGDLGLPIVLAQPECATALAFRDLARMVTGRAGASAAREAGSGRRTE